jgi:excisionase family DNA binding protein
MSVKRLDEPINLAGYLRVGEAARLVGVSRATLRNWDKAGKLRAVRHPMNGYRLYRRKDLESILKDLRRR